MPPQDISETYLNQAEKMASAKSYQGKKLLALGLGKFGNTTNPNLPMAKEVVVRAEKAHTDLEALGFTPIILSINPQDVEGTAIKPIRELIRGGFLPDVVSVGGGLRTIEAMVPTLEKLIYLIASECVTAGKLPRFAFPYGPERIIECVERVLADEDKDN